MRNGPALDPWGTPYMFYSPLGVIGGGDLDSDAFGGGAVTAQDDRFETFAIVSYGPDGQSDSASGGDDDLLLLFEQDENE